MKKNSIKICCEMDLCVYNEGGECLLEGISVNSLGACDEAMFPNIPEDVLEKYKSAAREG